MELGTGVFLATATALLVWQIDKRGSWRAARRAAIWLVGLVALVAGCGLAYVAYENHRSEQARAQARADDVRSVREGRLRRLGGVSLGDTRDEVAYLLGKGTATAANSDVLEWRDGSAYKAVSFNDNGRVSLIVCASNSDYSHCGSMAGLDLSSDESEVIATLGAPASPPTYDIDSKILTYGSRGGFLTVHLEKGDVAAFVLRSSLKEVAEKNRPAVAGEAASGPDAMLPGFERIPDAPPDEWESIEQ